LRPFTTGDNNAYGPAWSPDGNSLAYIRENTSNRSSGERYQLVTQSLEDTVATPVFGAEGTLSGASWSPDGSQLLVNENKDLKANLYRVDLEKQGVDTLSSPQEDVFPFRAAWAADSSLFYSSSGKIRKLSGNGTREEVPFSVNVALDRRPYARKQRDFDNTDPQTAKGIISPCLSPDGTQILFVALQDLWLKEVGGRTIQLTDDAFVQILPIWSPDGKQVAFSSDMDGSFGIWTMSLEDLESTKVKETGGSISGMAWSPDGKSIAYTQSFGPRLGAMSVLDLSSGESTRLSVRLGSSVGSPTWSPDGKTLALSALDPYSTRFREGVNKVVIMPSKGGSQRLQKAPEHWSYGVRGNDGPLWSPDGAHMALISKGLLWLLPVDENGDTSGDPIQLTEELADAPTWSSDSKKILYMATNKLKILDVATKTAEVVPLDLQWKRQHPEGTTLIHAGGLIDVVSDTLKQAMDILIEGHRIVEITPHDEARTADRVVDASDAFVMPGLIDICLLYTSPSPRD